MHRSWLCTIIIDCDDLEAGVGFWTGALGVEVTGRAEPFVWLQTPPGSLHIGIGLQAVPEPKTCKSRVHLDFMTDDLDAEVARLESLGARRQSATEWWWVMHDPCGNEFCVVRAGGNEAPESVQTWGT